MNLVNLVINNLDSMHKDGFPCLIDYAKALDKAQYDKLIDILKSLIIDGKDIHIQIYISKLCIGDKQPW